MGCRPPPIVARRETAVIAHFRQLSVFLMLLMALTSSILASPGAHSAGVSTDAAALWRTATTVMQQSVHSVHADGRVTEKGCCPSLDARWRITGNCLGRGDATRAHFWLRGRQSGQLPGAPVVAVNTHYIVLLGRPGRSGQRSQVWMRNTHTGNHWIGAEPDPASFALWDMCPALIIGRFQASGPATYRVFGITTVDHHAVWHLRRMLPGQGEVLTAELYIDQRTFQWVRIAGYDGGCTLCNGPSSQIHFTFDYSRVNAPLHITAPKVGLMTT